MARRIVHPVRLRNRLCYRRKLRPTRIHWPRHLLRLLSHNHPFDHSFTVKVQRTRALIRLRSNHYSPLKTLPGENKADIASRPHTTSSLEAEAQAPILAQRLSSVGNTIPLDQTVFLPQPPPDEVDSIPFTFRGERLPSEHALASRIPMTDYAPAKVQAQTLLISQIFAFTPTNTSAIATRQE